MMLLTWKSSDSAAQYLLLWPGHPEICMMQSQEMQFCPRYIDWLWIGLCGFGISTGGRDGLPRLGAQKAGHALDY
jgi:hypothetical protein